MISSFNIEKLTALLKDFYTVTGIRITVFDESFREIAAWPQKRPDFCEIVRSCPAARQACLQCDRKAMETAARRRGLFSYRCHAGLYESILPIYLNGLLIGYLFFGHVFRYGSYEEGWRVIRECCGEYPLKIPELLQASLHQPLIAADYLNSSANLMAAIASYLCMERLVSLRQENLPARIDEYIRGHLSEDIDAETVCGHFGIGKTRLYEITKESYGCGIAEVIRRYRLDRAKELLLSEPELPVSEIAALCGFQDYNNFITLFRRSIGITPRRFRSGRDKQADKGD